MCIVTETDIDQSDNHTRLVRCPKCGNILADVVCGGTFVIRIRCRKCKSYIVAKAHA